MSDWVKINQEVTMLTFGFKRRCATTNKLCGQQNHSSLPPCGIIVKSVHNSSFSLWYLLDDPKRGKLGKWFLNENSCGIWGIKSHGKNCNWISLPQTSMVMTMARHHFTLCLHSRRMNQRLSSDSVAWRWSIGYSTRMSFTTISFFK